MKHPLIRAWTRSARGNVAVMFALVLLPLIIAVGFAIDASQGLSTKRHVQHAVDAAALAGAHALNDSDISEAQITDIVKTIFFANLQTSNNSLACQDPLVTIDFIAKTVGVESDCNLPTMFGASISGLDEIPVANLSVSRAKFSKIDLALVLDVSGSMNNGTRMPAMKSAAKGLATKLLESSTGNDIRIGFAAYSDSVNAGVYGNRAQGKPDDDDSDGDGVDKVCVTERPQPAAFNDDLPGPGKWVGDALTICPDEMGILPLTSSLANFSASIDPLTTQKRTGGHIGLAWAWYLISPKWATFWPPGSAGASYSDPEVLKAVIIMSDGEFWPSNIGALGSSKTQALALCAAMQSEGIMIITVGFAVGEAAETFLRACAGRDDLYYEASTDAALIEVYAAIAIRLLSTTLTQ